MSIGISSLLSESQSNRTMKPDSDSPKARWKMGRVVLQRETAQRGGKVVIVVKDFATHLPQCVIDTVGQRLRAACGCGGTVKGKRIEMQGDQAARIRTALEAEGFEVAGKGWVHRRNDVGG